MAEGSEHIVYLNASQAQVFKLTRPGTYGAYYEEQMERVLEFQCTPRDYLERMELWEVLFGYAPVCVGITPRGQIVTRQGFVVGLEPSQASVDDFLEEKSLEAIRKNCWLWRKPAQASEPGEVVIGDARSDNFKLTEQGKIVPIDIRLWWRELAIDPPSKLLCR